MSQEPGGESVDLKGRVALVTGGAVRLGRAIALGVARAGANVALTYHRSVEAAQGTLSEIQALGREARAFQVDFSQPQGATTLVDEVKKWQGHVDILVNSAAIFEHGDWDDTTYENWDRHLTINLKAPFFLSQAFARAVKVEGAKGHIVNIADWRAVRPGSDHVAYTIAKAGLVAMTYSLAQALAPEIQVNAVAPGLILPPPGAGEGFMTRKVGEIPLGRVGSPDDVVRAVLYLLTSDFVTGELLYVTGGEHL